MSTTLLQKHFYRWLAGCCWISMVGCGVVHQAQQETRQFRRSTALQQAQVGISVFEPATGKYLVNYRQEKGFIPASTQKIRTAGLSKKVLPDTLPLFDYQVKNDTLFIQPLGYPVWGDKRFPQPDLRIWIQQQPINVIAIPSPTSAPTAYAPGWSWDDYQESFMPERSVFPFANNLVTWEWRAGQLFSSPRGWPVQVRGDSDRIPTSRFRLQRQWGNNIFEIQPYSKAFAPTSFPVHGVDSLWTIMLEQEMQVPVVRVNHHPALQWKRKTSPVLRDSVVREMLHISDNALAEQLLLQSIRIQRGDFNDQAFFDSLQNPLRLDPAMPLRWVDGSGLSRYNLASPIEQVQQLHQLTEQFGLSWLESVLPALGYGTLRTYQAPDNVTLFAKTGSMSGVFCLAGILHTAQGRTLYFSVMTNGFAGKVKPIRDAVMGYVMRMGKKL